MGQKRVSLNVAKAIKEAGYPPFRSDLSDCYGNVSSDVIAYRTILPTYFDVWLWLWREKKITVYPEEYLGKWGVFELGSGVSREGYVYSDPEEAIIAAIEYLAENDFSIVNKQ